MEVSVESPENIGLLRSGFIWSLKNEYRKYRRQINPHTMSLRINIASMAA